MQSLPVVIIRCEENEINQLDFRIQTDNIRCFILLSGLRKLVAAKDELEYCKFKYLKLKELSPPVQSWILSQSLASLLPSVIEAQRRNKQTLQIQARFENSREIFKVI